MQYNQYVHYVISVHTDLILEAETFSTSAISDAVEETWPLNKAWHCKFSNKEVPLSAAFKISAFNIVLPRAISLSDNFKDFNHLQAAFVNWNKIKICRIIRYGLEFDLYLLTDPAMLGDEHKTKPKSPESE